MRYGGNTSCVEVRSGNDRIILDAGTGLRKLGQSLLAEFKGRPLRLTLLLSHTHWDHIQGLPFFAPLYEKRCRLRILGGQGMRKNLLATLVGQMKSAYFPVPFSKLPGDVKIEELTDYNFAVGRVLVRAQRAQHPGFCVGYRLQTPGGSVVFFPDHEPVATGKDRKLVEFIRAADVLILDSQYDRTEYRKFAGWGHGCVDNSVALALRAGVKKLILFHHDPDHDDKKIDALLAHARRLVAQAGGTLIVEAAREGRSLTLVAK